MARQSTTSAKRAKKKPADELDLLTVTPGADHKDDDEGDSDEVVTDDLEREDGEISEQDARLDRRIIEGMLKDKDALIRTLESEGVTEAEIMRRAADLGISEALLRQVRGVEAELAGSDRLGTKGTPSRLAARTCLSCERVFLSTGPGNRLCMRCRGGDAGLAQF